MYREIIEYDPLTGVRTDFWNEDGKSGIIQMQDMGVAKSLAESAQKLREDDDYKAKGLKNNLLHVARVPQWVHAKLITDYNIKQPLRQSKECLKIIQRDFPWCMTAKGRY